MFMLALFILAFSSTFQYSKCENTQYQNSYQYPQNVGRQTNPTMGPQVDINGNPIMSGGGMQGQPMGGQQQPMMPPTSNMPTTGGNQMAPQNGISNQPFPQQNPGVVGQNPQFPNNQPFPNNQAFPGSPQFPHNHGGVPGTNQHLPNAGADHGFHLPEPPHDLHLSHEGVYAYGYIMHMIERMLNEPTARNNLYHLFHNLETVMNNPRSTPIIQEFFNRWSHAIGLPLGQTPTNVVVQNVPSSGSFFDMLKRKGSTLVNLANDVAMAKAKAFNSLFDNSIFSSAAQIGTNWANAGMQAVQGTISPIIGSTPSTTGQTGIGTPVSMTTPMVTVQ